jgi:hypothetical protein
MGPVQGGKTHCKLSVIRPFSEQSNPIRSRKAERALLSNRSRALKIEQLQSAPRTACRSQLAFSGRLVEGGGFKTARSESVA